eukprot:821302-Prymnesium_polylepis.1
MSPPSRSAPPPPPSRASTARTSPSSGTSRPRPPPRRPPSPCAPRGTWPTRREASAAASSAQRVRSNQTATWPLCSRLQ